MTAPRFLVDENLSVLLPEIAHAVGFEATHVVHIGLAGASDGTLIERVVRDDWVLVTNNVIEFRGRYRTVDIHPGVVFLVPSVGRDAQRALFRAAVSDALRNPDLVNVALEVDFAKNGKPRVRRFVLP